ncbi:tetratricopeptide repeat protein [Mucilaginibacter frigoritolerans]|uniref:Tetratricopeptide repeat protein n=1 Tax=Mucilaginibacter frigoritolerans TaxID=652788 RepID=A0A562TPA2_9SPHI|nr:tetratricopeptide repeat protein [Mucilaginibacter frigoritolerans]TWI95068.1 tetratricopeptide repeat protein [Mucilaginibacter frigoritolerans]
MNDWLVLIVIYTALFISSPLIAVLHELGHAFAYLILTKPNKIDIYIGSYGNKKNNIAFKLGKLHFYIKKSFPFIKGIGLCHSSKQEPSYINEIIILLAGPLFTVVAACIPFIIILNTGANLLVLTSCYIFLGFSVLSLINNLIPKDINKKYKVYLANDGKQILFALNLRQAFPIYLEAAEHYKNKKFEKAAISLKLVLEKAHKTSDDILRLIIFTSIETKQYDDAHFYLTELENKFKLSTNDLLMKATLLSLTQRNNEAITTYNEVLKKDKNNILALNNIGAALLEKEEYFVARHAFEKAIKLDPDFYAPIGNLGHLEILEGNLETGKKLVNQCLSVNENASDAYKVLGIYYLKIKDINQATINFNKAKELDNDIDLSKYEDELKALNEEVV